MEDAAPVRCVTFVAKDRGFLTPFSISGTLGEFPSPSIYLSSFCFSGSDALSTVSHSASTRHLISTPLEPPRAPFLTDGASSSRSSSRASSPAASTVSLQINYVPSKFAPSSVRQRKALKASGVPTRGGGVEAFRAGERRMPRPHDENYDGVDPGVQSGRARWNRFKWTLVVANTIYTAGALAALAFILTAWFDVWEHADVVRAGNSLELIFSTVAAGMAVFTAIIGWAGIVLNNRGFLAFYTFFLWISFALLVVPGYLTYKKYTFNLEGKLNKQWSDFHANSRLRIQNALGCCGYFSPFVEATVSPRCYSRTTLPGCKAPYLAFEKKLLKRWYIIVFGAVPVNIGLIVVGLLCSNHVTYRFGKGMMPKAYRLSPDSMAVIMNSYASQLADQYGPDMAEEIMARSRSNSSLAPISEQG
ncbi:hypothetical protein FB45DRAFT_755781 [Roridomyces roridus]|uniref:Tetraspanin Tsp2 n=1 Tax=Roridomyces roridus TaxID=1738132 RepID=A0AAD7FE24_9AGAR|nr:hypothetical protein FB45DRAFT_755781 [Roridomyces roridus]